MSLTFSTAIVVLLSLPSLLFAFARSMPSQVRAILIGAIVIVAAHYPYWAFGGSSAIGWYDEYDAVIPAYLLELQSPSDFAFSHSFAGGTEVRGAYPDVGSAYVDVYRQTLAYLGGPLGTLTLRIVGNLLLFAGAFASVRLLLAAPAWIGTVVGLGAVFSTAYPYAWLLGAYGWDFALMTWAPVLLLADIGNRARLAWTLVYAVIAGISASIVFWIPWVTLYTLLVVMLMRRRIPSTLLSNAPVIATIGVTVALVNIPTLQSIWEGAAESGRILRITGPDALLAVFGNAPQPIDPPGEVISRILGALAGFFLQGFYSPASVYVLGFPPTGIFTLTGCFAATVLTFKSRHFRYLAAILVPVMLGATLTFLAEMHVSSVLSAYRWDILYVCVPFLLCLIIGEFLRELAREKPPLAYVGHGTAAVLMLAIVVAAGSLSLRAINDMNAAGGWATLSNYPKLGQLANDVPLARAVSLPGSAPKPMLGPQYGLDVLDGVRRNFTWRRIAFWFETVPTKPISAWHTHRHALRGTVSDVNLAALRLANVRFILSVREIQSPELFLREHLKGIHLSERHGPFSRMVSAFMPDLSLAPDIYIYEIKDTWDRVFVPGKLIDSGVEETSIEYFKDLRNLPRHALLVPSDAPFWITQQIPSALTISSATKVSSGLEVRTGEEGGLLVYNQEYTVHWRALCDDRELPIFPINGMQMVVSVPKACRTVKFVY